ncbi:hypothetical protein GCM10025866_21820 [Naasia aerilata]|uniref:Uncharacterized protein n=1 Tax=Naasia aerilata TaxID=1162966 RepID=A0ABN6XMU1_9MICO|nr:hypothetical protein GCM10025866_21820 [Naasia aerilata]
MSQDTATHPVAPTDGTAHGFELRQRRRWPWIAGGVVAVAGIAAAIAIPQLAGQKSPNEVAGATLTVATAEGNSAEQALVQFVAEKVAPDYGIKVAFRGLSDSNTINRAVSDGEVAGTVYQHRLWLGQVLEANPDFKEEAATPVFRWGFGLWSDKWGAPTRSRTAGRSPSTPTRRTRHRACGCSRRRASSP